MQDLSGKPRTCPQHGASYPHGHETAEQPLTEEEYSSLAAGDPFNEAGLIAAGKKLCGMCGHKAVGEWRCTKYPASQRLKSPASFGTCPVFLKKPSVTRSPQPKKKGLPVPPGVIFLYFGRPERGSREHQGVVTVAWIESPPGILHLGFSFCSPKDRWCKVTGRDMALARLLRPLVMPFLYSPKRTAYEVARAVMSHDFGRLAVLTPGATMWGLVPSWTKNLPKKMVMPWKRPRSTHAGNAIGYMMNLASHFVGTPRREAKRIHEKMIAIKAVPGSPIDWQRSFRRPAPVPFGGYFIDEAAEISPETWARLDKVLQKRTRPYPSPLKIMAQIMGDIAQLEE